MANNMTPDRFIAAAFREIRPSVVDDAVHYRRTVLDRAAELARESVGDGELLRCPFCASNEVDVQVGCHMTVDAKVVCSTCGAEGPVFGTNAKTGDFTDQAITAWNTRASEVEGRGSTASDQPLFQRANDYKEGYWDGFAANRSVGGDVDDTKRIDWLETMANKPGGLLLHDGSETGRTGLGLRPGTLCRTLRQAIDAALAGVSEGKVNGN